MVKVQRTPARAALAEAIQAHAEAGRKVEQMVLARSRGRDIVEGARQRLDAARESIGTLRDERAAAISFAATTGATVPPETKLRDARVAEAQAADELEAAESALKGLDAQLAFYTSDYNPRSTDDPVALAAFVVHDAARAVVNEGSNIVARVEAADKALATARTAMTDLVVLANDGLIDPEHWPLFQTNGEMGHERHRAQLPYVAIRTLTNGERKLEMRVPGVGNQYADWFAGDNYRQADGSDRVAEWRAAFERLKIDPDAEMPL